MSESVIANLLADPWFPAAAAFVFGVIFGWLVRSVSIADAQNDSTLSGELGEDVHDGAPSAAFKEQINGVKAEIASIRELLNENDAEADSLRALLDNLDAAIKRANGRLTLIADSMEDDQTPG
ncbi:MAG: hypothetical protein AAGB02_09195 [Pseudomonadota bacterium]